MKIGNYKLYPVMTGDYKLDGGAMFGVVPKILWSSSNPTDELNRISMTMRALLLSDGKRNILIDTGIGNKVSRKFAEMYAVDNSRYDIKKSLKNLGFDMEDITDVILTHLHFDHAGGATYYNEDKILMPSFQNAVYFIQKKHYEWALNPSERDKASFMPENYQVLSDRKVLNPVNGEFILDEFIALIPVSGHTPYMQVVKISDGENTLLYAADLIPTSSHIKLPYIMGYDLNPLMTLDEKKEILKKSADENWLILFEHDISNECATINYNDKGAFLKEYVKLSETL